MSELVGKLYSQYSGISVVSVWSGLQLVMEQQGSHLQFYELDRFERLIEQRACMLTSRAATKGVGGGLLKETVKRYKGVFEHLLFDRVYLEALRESRLAGTASDANYGTEQFRPDHKFPLVPAGLTASLRAQWIQDFTALMTYAQENDLDAAVAPYAQAKKPNAAAARPLAANIHDPPAPPSKLDIQRKVNQHVYEKNKRLASENAAMERKVDRKIAAFRSLVAKIESTTGAKVAAGDPPQRVSEAVKLLMLHTENDDEEKENSPRDAEIQLLSEQLQKLNDASAALQNELAELQRKMKEIRQTKKSDKA